MCHYDVTPTGQVVTDHCTPMLSLVLLRGRQTMTLACSLQLLRPPLPIKIEQNLNMKKYNICLQLHSCVVVQFAEGRGCAVEVPTS